MIILTIGTWVFCFVLSSRWTEVSLGTIQWLNHTLSRWQLCAVTVVPFRALLALKLTLLVLILTIRTGNV